MLTRKQIEMLKPDGLPLTPAQCMRLGPNLRKELREIRAAKQEWLSAKWVDWMYAGMLGSDEDEL